MFRFAVIAPTLEELKSKLLDAACSIHIKDRNTEKIDPVRPLVMDSPKVEGPAVDLGNLPSAAAPTSPSLPPFSSPVLPSSPATGSALPLSPAEQAFKNGNSSATPANVGSVAGDRDDRGVPWNAEIHSGSKEKNKDGSWRSRRGVDKAVVKQKEAELLGAAPALPTSQVPQAPFVPPAAPAPMSTPLPSAPPANPFGAPPAFAPPPMAAQLPPTAPFGAPPPLAAQVPPTQLQQAVPTVPAVAPSMISIPSGTRPAYTFDDFKRNLLPLFALLVGDKKITQEWVEQVKAHYGLKEIWHAADNAVAAQELYDGFAQQGWITKV